MAKRKWLTNEEFKKIKYAMIEFDFKNVELQRVFNRSKNLITLIRESATFDEYQRKSREESAKNIKKDSPQEQPTGEEQQMLQETTDALSIKKIEERLGRIERILILIARSTNAITN